MHSVLDSGGSTKHELYQLVQLKNGTYSVRSVVDAETFHPVIGPVAEAEALYIRQLRLLDRIAAAPGEFTVWDVGLGAAANPLTLLSAASNLPARLKIVSFDHTREPLRFALAHREPLAYFAGFHESLTELANSNHVQFRTAGGLSIDWELHVADFPSLLKSEEARLLPKADAIFYDAFSPRKNPAMWTVEVFTNLFRLLSPDHPCAMPTYSRSTMLRVTLLLAGFFVGVGHATGEKEETTIAANTLSLLDQPLDHDWLGRVRRSRSAEPLRSAGYVQAPLQADTWERLLEHPQFS
jgi:tRNA U34 5-methylaminomethyl-2-thiouridine-forming methyltransferase MnmC